MVVKLVYSLLLAALGYFSVYELYRVWLDKRLFVGPFEYLSGTGIEADKGKAFSRRVTHSYGVIFQQLDAYQAGGSGAAAGADTTFDLGPHETLNTFTDTIGEVSLTYQNINIGQIFTVLRKSLRQPNEISGVVTADEKTYVVDVRWPRGPKIRDTGLTAFTTNSRATADEAAFQVACTLAWSQVASGETPIAQLDRNTFCRFTEVLAGYRALSAKAAAPGATPTANDDQALGLQAHLAALIPTQAEGFPDIYRLRADLVDLLSTDKRKSLLTQAQMDRLQYAILTSETLRKLPENERRQRAFALARPALVLKDGRMEEPPSNWAFLKEREASIRNAAGATGFVRRDGEPHFRVTAFRIDRGLIMTRSVVLEDAGRPRGQETAGKPAAGVDPKVAGLSFCTEEDANQPCPPGKGLRVTGIVFDGRKQGSQISVLRIADSAGSRLPELSIRSASPPLDSIAGNYAYVLGFPTVSGGANLPAALLDQLLGGRTALKRLLPGRTLALEDDEDFGAAAPIGVKVTTDINTTPGTGGAPLIDYETGQVIGVHIGGLWDPETGKFTLAELITPDLMAAIKKAMAPPEPAPAPGPGPEPGVPPDSPAAPLKTRLRHRWPD